MADTVAIINLPDKCEVRSRRDTASGRKCLTRRRAMGAAVPLDVVRVLTIVEDIG